MKRTWLLFAQAVTVMLAAYFVVATLKPEWLGRRATSLGGVVSVIEAPAANPTAIAPGSLSAAAKKASPAVVSINTSKAARRSQRSEDPWFRFFFGDQGADQPQVGLGSGVIVSTDGYILTNNHVVEGADEIEVTLNDSRHARGQGDRHRPRHRPRRAQDRARQAAGDRAGQLRQRCRWATRCWPSATPSASARPSPAASSSALGRNQLGINTFENFIQTDAAINPGNSGGALVDVNGNLEGINTAIYSRSGGSMGIGFAIPVSTAKQVLEDIVKEGKVTRGWIGVEPNDLSPELAETFGVKASKGVIITGVLQNGPAAQAGIRPGDVITGVGDKNIDNVQELLTAVAGLKPGNAARFALQRGRRQDGTERDAGPRLRTPIRRMPGEPE